jgi:DNA-binding NarL/FixJ family response regulator
MKVLVVDDHQIIREGLRTILEAEPGIDVVGEAANGHDAVASAMKLRPDVVLMDISMRDLNGIDATARITGEIPGVKVIGLSMHSDRRFAVAMLDAGASGYLLKDSAADELVRALRTVMSGQTYLSSDIPGLAAAVATNAAGDTSPLSSREREVLQLLSEGRSTKAIAKQLRIAVTTVETHRRQIMSKLNLRTIAELTKFAIREGLTTLEQ